MVLQALEQRLLGVGDVEGVDRRPRGHPVHRLALQADEHGRVLALEAGVDERGDRAGDGLHGLLELRGGAARGGRRVVELVREARGHLPERGEALAVVLHAVDEVGDALHRAHDAPEHRRVLEREAPEVLRLDARDAAVRLGAQPDAEQLAGQGRDRAHPRRGALPVHGLLGRAVDRERPDVALEQELQPRWREAVLGDDHPRPHLAHRGDRGPGGERVVVELVEEIDRAQVDRGDRRHPSTRYWWTSETDIEPSPTALATRLIDRARTSPATKTPGTVVSSR